MPKGGGGYGSMEVGGSVATELKRQAAKQVSHVMLNASGQSTRAPRQGPGGGKFGGLPGGPSGGMMGKGGKRKMGSYS